MPILSIDDVDLKLLKEPTFIHAVNPIRTNTLNHDRWLDYKSKSTNATLIINDSKIKLELMLILVGGVLLLLLLVFGIMWLNIFFLPILPEICFSSLSLTILSSIVFVLFGLALDSINVASITAKLAFPTFRLFSDN